MGVVKRGGGVVVGMGVRVRNMELRMFLRMAGEVHVITKRPRTCGLRTRNEVFCHRVDLVAHPIMM
jgi:hypothetical protein